MKEAKKKPITSKDDTNFLQMGEEGCGSRYPTYLLLLLVTIMLKWENPFLTLEKWVRRGFTSAGKKRNGGEGR